MFDILVLVLCAIVVYYFYRRNIERSRICEYLKEYNGPKPKPIIGNSADFGRNSVEALKRLIRIQDQYGPITKLFMGPSRIFLIISDPDLVEILLTSTKEITKSVDYELLRPWLFNGLILSTGKYWQKRRKIITPAFHFKILDNFIPIFNKEGDIMIQKLSAVIGKKSVDMWPFITAYTLDSMCETAMGTSVQAQDHPNNEYCQSVRVMCEIYGKRKFSFWKRHDFLFRFSEDYKEREKALKVLHGFTKSVIEKKRNEMNSDVNKKIIEDKDEDDFGRKKKIVFLDLLLQSGGDAISDEGIMEEIEAFMFAGHDTSSATACYCLFELGRHTDIQDKIVKESEEIFGDNENIQPTLKDLTNLKYLEMVIKETLRLYPVVPLFSRELENDLVYKGKIIPKGVSLSVFAYYMHKNPNIFMDPEIFNPDRFLPENLNKKYSFSYLPFSAGPRNCIGQKFAMVELKIMLSKILRHFRILPADPPHNLMLSAEILLKSKNGMCVQLEKRKM